MDMRVRHSKGKKRATLVTVRNGDMVFWGIARCNSSAGDRFDRGVGREIAAARAMKEVQAFEESGGNTLLGPGLMIHQAGLRGHCHVESIREVLHYFDEIHKNQLIVLNSTIFAECCDDDECDKEEDCIHAGCDGCTQFRCCDHHVVQTGVNMSQNGKGDKERKRLISKEEWDKNWENTFKKKNKLQELVELSEEIDGYKELSEEESETPCHRESGNIRPSNSVKIPKENK